MLASSHHFRQRNAAFFVFAAFAFLISCAAGPHNAHAAAITLVNATTTSSNASTTLAKTGDTVSYQVVLSGTPSATTTPVINIFNMGTTSMSGSGTTWTYSTTTSASWTNGFVSFLFGWGGSVGEATTTATQANLTGSNVRFDKNPPVITSITSTATTTGALKVGSTITFTLNSGLTEYGGSVTGSYNGEALTWNTSDGGNTFTSTYTVIEGQADQSTALQISSISLHDAAGNTVTASGSDIVKTIDANSPNTPTASLSSGTYQSNQPLTLSSAGADTIRYSIDGLVPTCSTENLYSGPLTLTMTSSLKVIGCDSAGNMSSVSSFGYTILGTGGGVSGSGGGGGGGGRSNYTVPTSVSVASNPVPVITGTVSAEQATTFVNNLTLGSVSNDVKMLQSFLNTHGFPIATTGKGSKGYETRVFGARTKAALAKFQASKGITPASGYFGPKTRAAITGK
jgi:hypothetical protein